MVPCTQAQTCVRKYNGVHSFDVAILVFCCHNTTCALGIGDMVASIQSTLLFLCNLTAGNNGGMAEQVS